MPPRENDRGGKTSPGKGGKLSGGGLRSAVFLDRDGTITQDYGYPHRPEDCKFIPGAPAAIGRLRAAGYLIVVVTNQSGIARGLYGPEDVERLHRHIQNELIRQGTAIDAFYFCPHHPEGTVSEWKIECSCRKGSPGLLFRAAADLDIDLAASLMVGDKASDVEAGRRAGCQPILVLTGWGRREAGTVDPDVPRVATIAEAVDRILEL